MLRCVLRYQKRVQKFTVITHINHHLRLLSTRKTLRVCGISTRRNIEGT